MDDIAMNTVTDVVRRLRIGRTTVCRLIRTGELRSVKVGARRLVPEHALAEFVANLERGDA